MFLQEFKLKIALKSHYFVHVCIKAVNQNVIGVNIAQI